MEIKDKEQELYCLFIFTKNSFIKSEFQLFFDKPSLMRSIRKAVDVEEWNGFLLSSLIRQLDAGKTTSIGYVDENRGIFCRKFSAKKGLERMQNSIVRNFIDDYFKKEFTKL